MNRSSSSRALLVGAGIGGPVLAAWLRRIGWDVVLADARPGAASAEGAFLGLAPNGMAVLAQLGVAEQVSLHGHPCRGFQFLNSRGNPIGSIDRSGDTRDFGWPLLMVRRGRLHELLTDEAVRAGATVAFGKRLVAVRPASDGTMLSEFDDGSVLASEVLIGCDGLRSTVRALTMPEAPAPRFTGLVDYGGFVSAKGPLPFPAGINVMLFGRAAFFGAFTTPNGETWWFHNGPPSDQEGDAQPSMRARLMELHRDDPRWVRELIEETPEILGPWRIHELGALKRWSEGRVCLLGDAAHAMSPSAGQGASLAIEDAVVLARALRDAVDPRAAFVEYERSRRPRVDALFRQARRNGSGKAPSNALSAWVRDRVLPLGLRYAASAQSAAYAYKIAWEPRAPE